MAEQIKLYSNLSWLWRMWGDPAGEYARYNHKVISWITKHSRRKYHTLLDLGCGGGKNVFTLKHHYQVTGLDLSPEMLSLCHELNPETPTICADMRDFSLENPFDIIYIDDAISYVTSREDLLRVLRCCLKSLAPDGLMVLTPDLFKEDFVQNETEIFQSIPHQLHPDTEVTYITNNYDPDPSDDIYECLFLYLIRQRGILTLEREVHTLGIFERDTWLGVLAELDLCVHQELFTEDDHQYTVYVLSKS